MTIEIDTMETYNTWDTAGEEAARDVWRSLPIAAAYPIGSRWVHPSNPKPVTILANGGTTLTVRHDGEEEVKEWDRAALDTYGRMAPDVIREDVTPSETPVIEERLTVHSVVPVGTRVKLIDARGDSSSSASVGDLGTVAVDGAGVLHVTMDDGHSTVRNTRRWALVKEEATPVELQSGDRVRITDAGAIYPQLVGTEVNYVGSAPENQGFYPLEVEFDEDVPESRGFTADNGRTHLYVVSVERVSEAASVEPVAESTEEETEPTEPTTEPYRPVVGDRVIVTDDRDRPDWNGKPAEVLEYRDWGGTHDIRVKYDDGSGYGSWWVNTVRPELPNTPEEYRERIAKAVEAAKQEVEASHEASLREARREGRQAAEQEAAAKMETIIESAHDYATRNELCRQFDLFMVENGLPPRDSFRREWTVELSTTVNARNQEEAIDAVMSSIQNGYLTFDVEVAED